MGARDATSSRFETLARTLARKALKTSARLDRQPALDL